jgi:zinc transport system ATP-binding protein
MTRNPVICVQEVDFGYDGGLVLSGVSFDIFDGEFAAFIGPNGGGKTTLLRLILGLEEPRRGTIRVFDRHPREVRRRIGYMAQDAELDLEFPVTVLDVVLMGRLGLGRSAGYFNRRDREACEQALEEVSCLDCRDRPFAALSSGQRQRVLIARALASDPALLLLDEPTSYLDPSVQDELHELLHRLNERLTLVVVSHDVNFVSEYVERVVCVNRNVAVHPTTEIGGEVLSTLFGERGLRLVRHDHRQKQTHDHDHTHEG